MCILSIPCTSANRIDPTRGATKQRVSFNLPSTHMTYVRMLQDKHVTTWRNSINTTHTT